MNTCFRLVFTCSIYDVTRISCGSRFVNAAYNTVLITINMSALPSTPETKYKNQRPKPETKYKEKRKTKILVTIPSDYYKIITNIKASGSAGCITCRNNLGPKGFPAYNIYIYLCVPSKTGGVSLWRAFCLGTGVARSADPPVTLARPADPPYLQHVSRLRACGPPPAPQMCDGCGSRIG